jgi:S1-C subfamily serine protease
MIATFRSVLMVGILTLPAFAQNGQIPISVDSTLVLDAAGPEQRNSLNSIYLVVCPGLGAGTGFLIDSGVMVTNSHVVGSCNEATLVGVTAQNQGIRFSKVIIDSKRDLALLMPEKALHGGFKLAAKDNPSPGTTVSTWGYPLLYNGASPLLSVGYISGYRDDLSSGTSVKHIVVNGAFNHGNSGGPLFVSHNNEIIGVVVLTYHFYPPEVKQIIDMLENQGNGFMMATRRRPDGTNQTISEAQVTAIVLKEFYEKTQVMIGEAIAASELKRFLAEHTKEIADKNETTNRH